MSLSTLYHSLENFPSRTTGDETATSQSALNRLARMIGRALASGMAAQPVVHVESASQLLERGQIAAIAQPGIQKIICEAGALWLTQDGRGKDIVLESGQEFQCEHHDRNARLLAYALTNARWRVD